jgi:hypothetical protein
MAAAHGYSPGGTKAGCVHLQPDGYDTDSLIKVLDQLAAFYGIEAARPVSDQGWGLLTAITLPAGSSSVSTSRHPTAAQRAEFHQF